MGKRPPSRFQGERRRVADGTAAARRSDTRATRDEARAAAVGTQEAPLDGLDRLEFVILTAIASGQGVPEIAAALGLAEELVGANVTSVLVKLHRRHAARSEEEPAAVPAEGGARRQSPAS